MSLRRFISFGIYPWVGDDFRNVQNATGIWILRSAVFTLYVTPDCPLLRTAREEGQDAGVAHKCVSRPGLLLTADLSLIADPSGLSRKGILVVM